MSGKPDAIQRAGDWLVFAVGAVWTTLAGGGMAVGIVDAVRYPGQMLGSSAGIVLIVFGIIALIYGGITYTTHKKVLDIGPIQAEAKETHNIPLPPVLGVVAIVGGGALLLVGGRGR